jgi:membrane protease YdiL (CAAX protease family)
VSESHDQQPDGERDPDLEPGTVLVAGTVIYGGMGAAALIWLWTRERSGALAEQAIGDYGPWASSGVGLVVGLIGAWLLGYLTKRFTSLQEVASAAQRVFARAGEGVGIAFVLISAIAEELFFRLAVQDLFGLIGSVACYVLLNSSVGGLRWILFTFAHALTLGLIVELGFGLLGSTTAHAILNYLSLRRIQYS